MWSNIMDEERATTFTIEIALFEVTSRATPLWWLREQKLVPST